MVLGICLYGSNYERRCVSREFLTHDREESVFVYPVVLLYQGVSPHRSSLAGELRVYGAL